MSHSEISRVTMLRRKDVRTITGLPASSMYALIKKGQFPPGVKLSTKAVGWPSDVLDAWIASRIAASNEVGAA